MAAWTATVEDKDKNVLAYCTTLSAGTLTLPLNNVSSFSATLATNGQDFKAIRTQLASGSVFLRLAVNGTTRFWGVLSDMQVTLGESPNATVTFTDLAGAHGTVYPYIVAGTYQSKLIYISKPYKAQTYNAIIDDLIGRGSPLVPLTRSGSATSTRTIMPEQATTLDFLLQLGSLANGIDWYVQPDNTLKIASTMGTDKSSTVMFQFGPSGRANITDATVQYLPPRNRVYVTGSDNNTRRRTEGTDATNSIAAYGENATTISQVDKKTITDADLSDARYRAKWRGTHELNVEPTLAPQPWTDYYLGDTVRIDMKQDEFSYSGTQRVNGIEITLDESLLEVNHKISFEER